MKTGGRRRSRRPKGGDEVGGDASGRLAGRDSVGRKRGSRRSFGAHLRGEAVALGAVVLVGGDGALGRSREKETEGGEEHRESEREPEGLRGVRGALGCLQRRAGKQEVAGACRRAVGTRPRVLLSRGGRRLADGCVGWASQ